MLATDNSSINAAAGAAAVAAAFGKVGVAVSVGVALAHNTIETDVLAAIREVDGTNARLAATDNIDVLADNNAVIESTAAAAALAISAGVVAVSLAGAGAYAENDIGFSSTATIVNSTIEGASSDAGAADVNVIATSDTEIEALIISAAAAVSVGAVGVAIGVGVALAENTIGQGAGDGVFASIEGSSILASNDVNVKAQIEEATINAEVVAVAAAIAAGAVGFAAAGTGSDADNTLNYESIAHISSSTLDVDGDVTVRAYDNSVLDSFVAAAAISASFGAFGGAVSIAVSLAENTVSNTINAYIYNSSIEATDVAILADDTSTLDSLSLAASLAASLSIGFTISGSGAETQTTHTNSVSAYAQGAGGNDLITLSGDMTVNAVSRPDIDAETSAISVSLGLIAMAAQGGVNTITVNPTVSAHLSHYNQVTADEVTINADGEVGAKALAEGMSISTGRSMGSIRRPSPLDRPSQLMPVAQTASTTYGF